MLVLSRQESEKFRIGDDIVITIVRIGPSQVRVGIDAPKGLRVLREELFLAESDSGPKVETGDQPAGDVRDSPEEKPGG